MVGGAGGGHRLPNGKTARLLDGSGYRSVRSFFSPVNDNKEATEKTAGENKFCT